MEAKQLLINSTAGSIFPGRPNIVYVTRTDPVSVAFQKMIDNKILSVPVYDRAKNCFTCFLDMVDVVAFSVKQFVDTQTSGDINKLLATPLFKTATCGEVSDLSRRNPFLPVESSAPVLEALNLMVKWGVHRIPVVDAEGELITVLSQSQVVTFVFKYLHLFNPALLQKPADSFAAATGKPENGSGSPGEGNKVVSVNTKDRAIDAFIAMHDKRVSGVAVVDDDGKIVGNISASDLKTIGYDGTLIARLFYPVSKFLKLIASHGHIPSPGHPPPPAAPPVVAHRDTSFRALIGTLVNARIHRVYVVDDENRPAGVVGFSEVLRAVQQSLDAQT